MAINSLRSLFMLSTTFDNFAGLIFYMRWFYMLRDSFSCGLEWNGMFWNFDRDLLFYDLAAFEGAIACPPWVRMDMDSVLAIVPVCVLTT
jgi:hypothetical protein